MLTTVGAKVRLFDVDDLHTDDWSKNLLILFTLNVNSLKIYLII